MYLTSLTQRDRLFDVATSWLRGRPQPGDGTFITEVFLLEHSITWPLMARFLRDIATPLTASAFRLEHLHTKDQLRQRIVASRGQPSRREAQLFSEYRGRAEQFFPATPVDLVAATRGDGALVAMCRFKGLMRIADKAARRIADRVRREVNRKLELQVRARGGPSSRRSPQWSVAETEQQVCHEFVRGWRTFTKRELTINDLVGAKFIGGSRELDSIDKAILSHPDVLSLTRSEHRGVYNDVSFTVELPCPPSGTTIDRLNGAAWWHANERGLASEVLLRDIPGYVESGAKSVSFEIILTTWEELVESEFGRGLHEERIAAQRGDPRYSGWVGRNAALASAFLLAAAVSPVVTITDVPVKLSGRYLPDVLCDAVSKLFGLHLTQSPLHTSAMVDTTLMRSDE
jgi:hypothetical protein